MGYRSEVCFEISAKKEVLLNGLAFVRMGYEDSKAMKEVFEHLKFFELEDGEAILRFYGESWKWYPEYKDVKALWKIWCHFGESAVEDENISGQFVRIGEEADDIQEESFNGYANMYVPSPSLCFDRNFSAKSVSLAEFKGEILEKDLSN